MNISMTRRTLLRSGSLLAASSLLPHHADAMPSVSSPASPIRLGIASYTFRKFDDDHLIQYMKELKTPLLNLKDMHLPMTPVDQIAPTAQKYRDAGMTLTAAGNITLDKDTDEDVKAKFEYLKLAGIPIMVCAPTHEVLPRMEKFAKQYNIKVAIHNHGPEDKNFPAPSDVLNAVKNMGPMMGCCIDLGHAMRAGADVVQSIHDAGPRLFDIHIKDLANGKVRESQVAVGQGLMPVHEIFEALIKLRYPGNVDLEYEIFPDDPMPGVMQSFAYMRGVLAGMGYKA
jgi:sugar phosphate isomerase/epimerase